MEQLKLPKLINRYLLAVAKYWYAIVVGIALGWVDVFERVFATWWIFPVWVRVCSATLGLVIAQFFAYRDLEVERIGRIRELEAALETLDARLHTERTPPEVYNVGGTPNPIRISGSQHSVHGPFTDLWGGITVVNPTQIHMKVGPVRLVIGGVDWQFTWIRFHLRSDDRERYERISMMGNEKQDYNLHFLFPDDKLPIGKTGELWMISSNREDEPFAVEVSFI